MTMMNIKSCISRGILVTVLAAASLLLTGCVDQHPEGTKTTTQTETVESMLEITDPVEKQAVEVAKAKVRSMEGSSKIVATSPAVADICDKLELDLVGVCSSSISTIPERYKAVTTVGTAMSPDMEIVASLKPDWILSPISLQSDLEPKYENIGVDWAFLNLRSVQGMYRSIQELLLFPLLLPSPLLSSFSKPGSLLSVFFRVLQSSFRKAGWVPVPLVMESIMGTKT